MGKTRKFNRDYDDEDEYQIKKSDQPKSRARRIERALKTGDIDTLVQEMEEDGFDDEARLEWEEYNKKQEDDNGNL